MTQLHSRGFKVKFLPPTNMEGARVSIKDTYFGERIVRSYDYFIGDIREQALNVLVERDIKPTGQVICLDGEYILVSDSFDNRLK